MKRYYCGNGEGMFDSKDGHWVMYDDVKQLQEENKKLKEDYNRHISLKSYVEILEQENGILKQEKQELLEALEKVFNDMLCDTRYDEVLELIKKHKK